MTDKGAAKNVWRVIGLAIDIGLLTYVLHSIDTSQLSPLIGQSPELVVAAFLLLLTHTILVWLAWHYSLIKLSQPISPRITAPVFFGSMLSRYLPGGIWHIAGRIGVMRKFNINTFNVSASITMEQAAGISLSVLLGATFLLHSNLPTGGLNPITFLILGVIGIAIFNPWTINRLLKFASPKANNCLQSNPLGAKDVYIFLAIHILALIAFGFGYLAIAATVVPDNSIISYDFALGYVGMTLLATFAGFVTPLVPGGIGVREAILAGWLSTTLPLDIASLVAIAPRALIMLGEILLFLTFTPKLWLNSKHEEAANN